MITVSDRYFQASLEEHYRTLASDGAEMTSKQVREAVLMLLDAFMKCVMHGPHGIVL